MSRRPRGPRAALLLLAAGLSLPAQAHGGGLLLIGVGLPLLLALLTWHLQNRIIRAHGPQSTRR